MKYVCPVCQSTVDKHPSHAARAKACGKACWEVLRARRVQENKVNNAKQRADGRRESRNRYRLANPEKVRALRAKYREAARNDPSKVERERARQRGQAHKRMKELRLSYLKQLFWARGLETKELPSALIEAKRSYLAVKRLIQERNTK